MTNPITIIIDDNVTEANFALAVALDPNDDDSLLVSYNGQTLPDQESLLVDYLTGQIVRLIINDFVDHAGQAWTVSASPLTRANTSGTTWSRNGAAAAIDEDNSAWPHDDNYLPVTISATNPTAAKRRRVIHIKMKTSDPGPGRPLK